MVEACLKHIFHAFRVEDIPIKRIYLRVQGVVEACLKCIFHASKGMMIYPLKGTKSNKNKLREE